MCVYVVEYDAVCVFLKIVMYMYPWLTVLLDEWLSMLMYLCKCCCMSGLICWLICIYVLDDSDIECIGDG